MFPIAEDIHVLRSLKQRSIMEFCSVPLHLSRISAHTRAYYTLRAIKRLKEKPKECSLTLTRTHPGTFNSVCFFIVRLSRSCKVNKTKRKLSIEIYLI